MIPRRLVLAVAAWSVFTSLPIRPQLRKITNAPNDPKMKLSVKSISYIHTPSTRESQISLPFALQSLVFQIIELFGYSSGHNCDFVMLEKNR